MKHLYSVFLILLLATQVKGQIKTYNLFHPVPKNLLREMETDRPDVTESPITTDAGHFQYEGDLIRFEKQHQESSVQNTFIFNQANLKLGITNSTAVQLVVENFVYAKEKSNEDGNVEKKHGFGDLTLRLKQNLVGNDKGKFAIALLPYVKFPTSKIEENNRYEFGIIVPLSFKFTDDLKLGMQFEADRLQNDLGNGRHTQILESLTIGYQLVKHIEAIAETYYTLDTSNNHWNNFLNAAIQADIYHDVKIDGGLNYGIQHDAMKSFFLGLSFRL